MQTWSEYFTMYSNTNTNTFQCIRIRIRIHSWILRIPLKHKVLFANMTYVLVEGTANYVLNQKWWYNLHSQKDVSACRKYYNFTLEICDIIAWVLVFPIVTNYGRHLTKFLSYIVNVILHLYSLSYMYNTDITT